MVAPTVVLLPSPFLGPASLAPLADEIAARGHPVLVPDLTGTVIVTPVHQLLIGQFTDTIDEAEPSAPLVLVGHSGTGPLLPAFADAIEIPVACLVHLDAGLPTPGRSWRDTVPAELYADLRSKARDGRLPPWHRWFEPDPLVELVPDPAVRAAIEAEQPEIPVSYMKEQRPTVTWPGPSGYLMLSPPYADEARQAEESGWPVRRLDAHHLAPATDPAPVADALLDLMSVLLRAG